MDDDGKHKRDLTPPDFFAEGPSLSPDGKRVAVWRCVDAPTREQEEYMGMAGTDNADELYVLAVSGGPPLKIFTSKNGNRAKPVWTPDGRQLLFAASGTLQRIGADGTGLKAIMSIGMDDTLTSITADGAKAILVQKEFQKMSQGGGYRLYARVLDLSTLTLSDLTSTYGLVVDAVYSPDGKSIAFTCDEGSEDGKEICVAPASAKDVWRERRMVSVASDGLMVEGPAWMGNDAVIAGFHVLEYGAHYASVLPVGKKARRDPPGGILDGSYSWSPDR